MASKKPKPKKRRPICPECKKFLEKHVGFIDGWGKFAGLICINTTCVSFMNAREGRPRAKMYEEAYGHRL